VWLGQLVTGDLGFSTAFRRPVGPLLVEAARNSIRLVGAVLLFQFVVGIAAGVVAAARRGGWIDLAVRWSSALAYATPGFVIGLGLIAVFGTGLGWLPATQMHSIDIAEKSAWLALVDRLRHLVMPCLALALPGAAAVALYTRDTLAGVLERPFLQSARSRGLSPARVLLRHGLFNAMLPIVQLFGLSLPGLVGGSVVVETLFAWPGMGRLAHHAVLARDEPLILGCTLVAVVAVLLGSLTADLLSAALDPRIRDSA
jgi:peptide/nickel transport system permease protein